MTKDVSNVLTMQQQREIIVQWIGGGTSAQEIAEEYQVSTRTINLLINDESPTRLIIEREMVKIPVARENQKIAIVKDKILEFYADTMDQISSDENLIKYTKDVNDILNSMDRIARLNAGEATERTEHTERTLDIAELSKQLKTTDDKKEFLLKQLQK